MDNQLVNLSKIFTDKLFRIPDYQRGYAWTEKQLKDFWNDLEQLELGQNHYTGVLNLQPVDRSIYAGWEDDVWIIESRGFEPYFVVDGQQRLTTSIILIQTILEHLEDNQALNFTPKSDIKKRFIFESKDGGISRSYIFGYEKDNPSYNFLKANIFGEPIFGKIEDTVYTQNLIYAKQFFKSKLLDKALPETEALYRKVTQNLLFNIFVIANEIEVCVAFETMNNRGKPLSYLELMKNRLIYLSIKFDEKDHERRMLRKAINNCWRTLYYNLGRNKDRPLDDDKFLQAHYLVYFRNQIDTSVLQPQALRRRFKNPPYAEALLENIFVTKNISSSVAPSKRITLNSVYRYVSSLQDAIETCYTIFNPHEADFEHDVRIWLDKLNRLGMDEYLPLVLIFFQKVKSASIRESFLHAVERHIFVSSLVRYYPG